VANWIRSSFADMDIEKLRESVSARVFIRESLHSRRSALGGSVLAARIAGRRLAISATLPTLASVVR
jgi:hypothetical protein